MDSSKFGGGVDLVYARCAQDGSKRGGFDNFFANKSIGFVGEASTLENRTALSSVEHIYLKNSNS